MGHFRVAKYVAHSAGAIILPNISRDFHLGKPAAQATLHHTQGETP